MAIRDAAGLDGKTGELVEVEGVYRVHDMGRYKTVVENPDGSLRTVHHYSTLQLDDGSTLHIGTRHETEHAHVGHRVRVRGRYEAAWPPRQPPHVAQPDAAPHLVAIELVEAT